MKPLVLMIDIKEQEDMEQTYLFQFTRMDLDLNLLKAPQFLSGLKKPQAQLQKIYLKKRGNKFKPT